MHMKGGGACNIYFKPDTRSLAKTREFDAVMQDIKKNKIEQSQTPCKGIELVVKKLIFIFHTSCLRHQYSAIFIRPWTSDMMYLHVHVSTSSIKTSSKWHWSQTKYVQFKWAQL